MKRKPVTKNFGDHLMYIGGEFVASDSGEWIDSINLRSMAGYRPAPSAMSPAQSQRRNRLNLHGRRCTCLSAAACYASWPMRFAHALM